MFNFSEHNHYVPPQVRYYGPPPKKYGFFSFMWDLFMILITGGLWLIWIFAREMRNR